MFKLLLVLLVVSSTSAFDPIDVLTCGFCNWCYLKSDGSWLLSTSNTTFHFAYATPTTTGAMLVTAGFVNPSAVCFAFEYKLHSDGEPVVLTISSWSDVLFRVNSDQVRDDVWLNGQVTIPPGMLLQIKFTATSSKPNILSRISVANFGATNGKCS